MDFWTFSVAIFLFQQLPFLIQAQYYHHYSDHEDPRAFDPPGQQALSLYEGWSIREILDLCTNASKIPCPLDKLDQNTERGAYLYNKQSYALADAKGRILRFEEHFGTFHWRKWVEIGYWIPLVLSACFLCWRGHWDLRCLISARTFDGSFGLDPILYKRMKYKVQKIPDAEIQRILKEEKAVVDVSDSESDVNEEYKKKYTIAQQAFLRRKRLWKNAAARTTFVNLERKRYLAELELIKKENARTGFLSKSADYRGRIANKFAKKEDIEMAKIRQTLKQRFGTVEEEEYEIASRFK